MLIFHILEVVAQRLRLWATDQKGFETPEQSCHNLFLSKAIEPQLLGC